MNEKLYLATYSENAVEVAAQNGLGLELNDLCISENMDEENAPATLAAMRQEIEASGADRVIIHGPFTEIIPASIDHRAVELGMTRLNEAYAFAEKLGVKRMIVHTGYVPLLYFRQWHLEKSLYFWKSFMADKPDDFQICIENVFEEEPTVMRELAESIDDNRIKLCLDVGHANAVTLPDCEIFDWIRVMGPHIAHFHLHNNNGHEDLHAPLPEGTMDMKRVLECIEAYCPAEATFTIESRTCASSVKWLEEQGFLK